MKKSILFLVIAVLIMLGCLTAYNLTLKKIYIPGGQISRFSGMQFSSFAGINQISVKSANRMDISIEHGEKEGVWIYKSSEDNVILKFSNGVLDLSNLDTVDEPGYEMERIIIVTKTLSALKMVPAFKGKCDTCSIAQMNLINLKMDYLDLQVAPNVVLNFHNTKVNKLNAVIGNALQDNGGLTIYQNCEIENAYFNVLGKSTLDLLDPKIKKATYKLSDSATVILNGKALEALNKSM